MMETYNRAYVFFLSVVAAIGGILYGYDTAVISGTIGLVTGQFSLDAMHQGWYVGCALIGSIAGVLCAGWLSDKIGRKLTMLIAATLFSVSAIGCAVCSGFDSLVVYRIVGGVGIGIVSIVSPIYISEISPAKIRGTMVALYQLAITLGFVLAYLANFLILKSAGTVQYGGFWAKLMSDEMWRGMLGSESVVALLFLFIILLIPESPRWLVTKGRLDKARALFVRISGSGQTAEAECAAAQATVSKDGDTSGWRQLLEPGLFKAVLIGSAIAILGQFMGVNAVLYYGPSIFENAGLSSGDSMFSQVLVGMVNMLTTILAVFIIDKVGRKNLIYWGVSGMIVCLVCIAVYFAAGSALGLGNTFLLVFFLLYIFCCAISICAVVNVLLSEMYPNRVRGRAMSIAGFALWVGTYLIGQLTPWFLENLTPAGTFLFFALMCVPYMLIMWKLVPETTGKTLEEIEAYWKNKNL